MMVWCFQDNRLLYFNKQNSLEPFILFSSLYRNRQKAFHEAGAALFTGAKSNHGEKKTPQYDNIFSIQVKWKICPSAGTHSVILANGTLRLDRIQKSLEVESREMKGCGGQGVSLSLVGIVIITYNLSVSCVSFKMKIKLESESSYWFSLYPRMADSDGSFRCR